MDGFELENIQAKVQAVMDDKNLNKFLKKTQPQVHESLVVYRALPTNVNLYILMADIEAFSPVKGGKIKPAKLDDICRHAKYIIALG